MTSRRPPSSAGGGSRPPTANRPTTSNRPRTGRPTTGRPTTAAGNQNQNQQGLVVDQFAAAGGAGAYWQEEIDEEEYYESDDEDVFAFVAPDLGPSPQTLTNYDPNPYGHSSTDQQQQQQQQQQQEVQREATTTDQSPATEDETFYYDEATGAVYDSAGRLVQMPAGFDASGIIPDQQSVTISASRLSEQDPGQSGRVTSMSGSTARDQAAANFNSPSAERLSDIRQGLPLPVIEVDPRASTSLELPPGARRTEHMIDPRVSLERKSSNSSSFVDVSGPVMSHANNIDSFPSMDVLQEVERLNSSGGGSTRSESRRIVGVTVGGGIMTDSNSPTHVVPVNRGSKPRSRESTRSGEGNGMRFSITMPPNSATEIRQRGNRLSFIDGGRTPDDETKFDLEAHRGRDSDSRELERGFKMDEDAKYELGDGDGLAHPTMDGVEVGSRGVKLVQLEMEVEEDSPYPEVRASVSNIDDPDMPVLTIRMWILSLLLTTLAGGANMFFIFRYPAPSISPTIVVLIAWPLGKLMAAFLPIRTFYLPNFLGGASFSLNPGVFNIKEHALISVMANVAIGQAYSLNTIIAQDSPQFYNDPRPVAFGILFTISSQVIGFSLAGMCRRFLVWPASMIWPQNLVTATILNTLHAEEDGMDGTMTRFRFFTFVGIGAFFFYWLPGFLFQALSVFNWVCWIWPKSVAVNSLFGVATGLGMSVLTFDWTQIIYIGSPLVVPWWAECNIFAGFVLTGWILAPILYFTNTWDFGYFEINASTSYDRFGDRYDVRRVLTADGKSLDVEAYEAYSPLYLATTYILVYWTGFATATAVLVHTALYHGKSLVKGLKYVRTEEDDVHAKRMRHYPEVPDWWYGTSLLLCFALTVITIEVYNTGLPVWALLVALAIPAIYILPAGFVFAMTGQQIGTNLISEFVAGYMLPGKPLPNMVFKVYALQGLISGLSFVQDLKLGHYMKIPPRATFSVQIVGTVWAAIVQVGVQTWVFGHIEGLCTEDQANHFTCPHASVFYTSSIVWGAISPQRLFGPGSLYHPIYWALLVGALIPIPFWLASKRWPKNTFLKYISWPIIFTGNSFLPPGTGINYASWFLAGFIFQYMLRRYNFRWWSKYNFVAAAALDSGTVISALIIFLTLVLPKNGSINLNWRGNTIFLDTLDVQGARLLQVPEGGIPPRIKNVL